MNRRKTLIALIVCSVMISAFAMMSVASATSDKPLYQNAGESPFLKVNWEFFSIPAHDTKNTETGHYVLHTKTGTPGSPQVANINSNNPNCYGQSPPP